MTTTPHSHLFRAKPDSDVFMRVSAEQAGLERLNMIAMALAMQSMLMGSIEVVLF